MVSGTEIKRPQAI